MRENQFRRKKRANTIPLQIQIWILVYRSIASGAPLKNNTRFPRLLLLRFSLRIIALSERCFTTRNGQLKGVLIPRS